MNAVIWVRNRETQLMAQLMDRPYVQHLVEQLVRRGVEHIHFLDLADAGIESYLGDGTRWGVRITFPRRMEEWEATSEQVVFGEAGCLPALPLWDGDEAGTPWPTLYFHDQARTSRWTGWALVPADGLMRFAEAVMHGADWREAGKVSGLQFKKSFLEEPSLSVVTPAEILASNRKVLRGEFPGLRFHATEREPGVWVARGARVAATAVLEAPCFVGENAWIADGCLIGPDTVVGADCVIEKGTHVLRSVVAGGTYLGLELDVADSHVRRNLLQNTRLDVEIQIGEEHVASELDGGGVAPAVGRALAGALVILAGIVFWMV